MEGIRLRCRAHNQFGAECTFGAEFMRHKRIAAAEARVAAKVRAEASAGGPSVATVRAQAAVAEQAAREAEARDVVLWLRQLGFSAREACDAAELCRNMCEASLEERVRVALSYFHVRGTRVVPAEPPSGLQATERALSAAC